MYLIYSSLSLINVVLQLSQPIVKVTHIRTTQIRLVWINLWSQCNLIVEQHLTRLLLKPNATTLLLKLLIFVSCWTLRTSPHLSLIGTCPIVSKLRFGLIQASFILLQDNAHATFALQTLPTAFLQIDRLGPRILLLIDIRWLFYTNDRSFQFRTITLYAMWWSNYFHFDLSHLLSLD